METQGIPAGLVGRYYAARHSYGHYRSCGVAGRYILLTPSLGEFTALLRYSLRRVLDRHPALCFGLLERTAASEAQFFRLPCIKFEDIVEFRTSDLPPGQEDLALSKELGIAHEHMFTEQTTKPAWKLVVLQHLNRSPGSNSKIDVAFISHHAVADGKSGVAFHKSLFKYMQEASSRQNQDTEWPYHVPKTLNRPPYVEDALPPPSSSPPPLQKRTEDFKYYTFTPPFLPSISSYHSRTKIISIPSSNLSSILTYTRSLNTTLTGLIHSLLLLHLSHSIPSSTGYRFVTPFSMRRFTHISDDEITNHIAFISTNFDAPLVQAARAAAEDTAEERQVVTRAGEQYKDELSRELEQVPEFGATAIRNIAGIEDFDRFCEEGMKGEREETWEVSNIGLVKLGESDKEGDEGVRVEKLVFSQCGMVIGGAIGCSVICLKNAPLVLTLSWQEGVLEEEFVDGLGDYLERRLTSIGTIV